MEAVMELKKMIDRFFLDMVINELRLANFNDFQHVTYNSLLYLDIIAYKRDCTVSYIADTLHVAKSAVTLKVKELEKLGLVEKVQSTEDKRVFYLHVNEAFLDVYKDYDRVLYDALDHLEEKYSEAELSLLYYMLDTINRRFEEGHERQKRK